MGCPPLATPPHSRASGKDITPLGSFLASNGGDRAPQGPAAMSRDRPGCHSACWRPGGRSQGCSHTRKRSTKPRSPLSEGWHAHSGLHFSQRRAPHCSRGLEGLAASLFLSQRPVLPQDEPPNPGTPRVGLSAGPPGPSTAPSRSAPSQDCAGWARTRRSPLLRPIVGPQEVSAPSGLLLVPGCSREPEAPGSE